MCSCGRRLGKLGDSRRAEPRLAPLCPSVSPEGLGVERLPHLASCLSPAASLPSRTPGRTDHASVPVPSPASKGGGGGIVRQAAGGASGSQPDGARRRRGHCLHGKCSSTSFFSHRGSTFSLKIIPGTDGCKLRGASYQVLSPRDLPRTWPWSAFLGRPFIQFLPTDHTIISFPMFFCLFVCFGLFLFRVSTIDHGSLFLS